MSRGVWIFIFCILGYFLVVLLTRTPDFFSGRITTGKVISITVTTYPALPIRRGSRKTRINVPNVEYVVDGKTYLFFDNYCRWPPIYKEGEEVRIIYDPLNPQKSYLFSLIGYWINLSELIVGSFIVGIPLAIYLAVKKRKSPLAG